MRRLSFLLAAGPHKDTVVDERVGECSGSSKGAQVVVGGAWLKNLPPLLLLLLLLRPKPVTLALRLSS